MHLLYTVFITLASFYKRAYTTKKLPDLSVAGSYEA